MGAEKKVSYDLKRFAGIKRDYNQVKAGLQNKRSQFLEFQRRQLQV